MLNRRGRGCGIVKKAAVNKEAASQNFSVMRRAVTGVCGDALEMPGLANGITLIFPLREGERG